MGIVAKSQNTYWGLHEWPQLERGRMNVQFLDSSKCSVKVSLCVVDKTVTVCVLPQHRVENEVR